MSSAKLISRRRRNESDSNGICFWGFLGKPLTDLCGYPMILWVYDQVKKVKDIGTVYMVMEGESNTLFF